MPVLELLELLALLVVVAVGLLEPLVVTAGAVLDERVAGISLPRVCADDDDAAAVVVAVAEAEAEVEAVEGSFNFNLRLAVAGRVTGVSLLSSSSSGDGVFSTALIRGSFPLTSEEVFDPARRLYLYGEAVRDGNGSTTESFRKVKARLSCLTAGLPNTNASADWEVCSFCGVKTIRSPGLFALSLVSASSSEIVSSEPLPFLRSSRLVPVISTSSSSFFWTSSFLTSFLVSPSC